MRIVNFAEQDTIVNRFMSELRDVTVQQDRMRFRRNLERIGEIISLNEAKEMMWLELSLKTEG